MPKYLLKTNDGEQVVVTTTQAGEMIQTPSGKMVEVPPLRELKTLPVYEESVGSRPAGSQGEWNRAAGLLFALGFVIMLVGLTFGGFVVLQMPEAVEVEPLETTVIDQEFQTLPAKESLDIWTEFSENGYLDKIRDLRTHGEMNNLRRDWLFKVALGGFGLGAVGLAIVIGAAVMGNRSPRG